MNADGSKPATLTDNNFWRVAIKSDGVITGYKPGCYNAVPAADQVGAGNEAVKYTGGKCYYAIFVQDKNAGSDQELALRYTIKRNTLFDVVISSISGPGSNTPGGVIPDPTKPVETVVQMDVTISVANWTVANLSAGI